MRPKAVLSEDGRYRYALWRDTDALGGEGTILFVMLNPSTADADHDDPTIRRCVRFARDWGYAKLAVGNLYALRATDPSELALADDPIGPENDVWLRRLRGYGSSIAAWGTSAQGSDREAEVIDLLTYGGSLGLDCLGQTKTLAPRHPLYVKAATRPKRLRQLARSLEARRGDG